MAVFVLDRQKRPLMPCSEKRARLMLARGRAVVHKRYPFTIRLKDRVDGETQPLRLGIDPGSRITGLALMRENSEEREVGKHHVLCLFELVHRGFQIREALDQRRAFRRRRRTKNLRHRAPRFDNRTRRDGWLAPSLQHRVDTLSAWVDRLCRLAPITSLSQELVRFDTQKLDNPEISGVEYQQGTLLGYEVREYLLVKWGHECAYCGATNTPLEIEHIESRSHGGSDRIGNLTLACHDCNQEKGADTLDAFFATARGLKKRLTQHRQSADARYRRVIQQHDRPLRDASAVNATRWALNRNLKRKGLPVAVGTGGLTKYNRQRLGIPKTHALDAACVGQVEALHGWQVPTLTLRAMGRGSYQRTRLDKFGFPRGILMRRKQVHGFQTGDMVKAVVPSGKKAGTHVGRVAIRQTGSFNIQTEHGVVQGISWRHCTLLQRGDGYCYHLTPTRNDKGEAGRAVA
ncbi:RNA-guided endonuclease IscB [Halomonas cerina]|uniref:5-methylcytosine-specific restriction endonuclease McrA n=1 Tax=Halomonas cerina TaxID=447424 RepID=A0A839V8Q2_9GAMM|nr:RNA-guided endonuclease IscB [Halomonas cerina]MBB3191511.1 5-methylcytosine-specific restriction endonuclease McrA [Halomonas cerina]